MEIVGIGAVAGLIAAAVCMMFYRKGVRDGMNMKRGAAPQAGITQPVYFGEAQGSDEEALNMMKRYEAILSYDPYGSSQKAALFERSNGECV